MCQTKHM